MIVRVPASSANLGPGFDVLGVALSMHAEFGWSDDAPPPEGAHEVDLHHPASVAYARCGGTRPIWVKSSIPMARGLGFSGVMRVGGAVLAHVERQGPGAAELDAARTELLGVTAELEGHADNAAASLFGGVVVAVDGRATRVPLGVDPSVVVWVPPTTTRTKESRTTLPEHVALPDAVFNVGRACVLIAALAGGDVESLRLGTQDRLHQDQRLARHPTSRVAMAAMLDAGAWGAWLSGSGPTVAAFCSVEVAQRLDDALSQVLPGAGSVRSLRIDHEGVVIQAG